MGGVVLGLAGAALVAATGLATAAVIGIRSLSELVLAAYVVAFAEIVGLTLALSTLGAMSRGGFVFGDRRALPGLGYGLARRWAPPCLWPLDASCAPS